MVSYFVGDPDLCTSEAVPIDPDYLKYLDRPTLEVKHSGRPEILASKRLRAQDFARHTALVQSMWEQKVLRGGVYNHEWRHNIAAVLYTAVIIPRPYWEAEARSVVIFPDDKFACELPSERLNGYIYHELKIPEALKGIRYHTHPDVHLHGDKAQLEREEIGRQALELFSGPYRNRIAALRELASLLQLVEEATEAAKAQSKDPSEETHRLKDRHEHIQLLFVIVYWLSPSGERSSLKKQVDDAIKLKVVVDLVALEALGNWRQVQEESSEEDLSAEPQPEPSAAGSHDSDSSDQPDPNVRQADITPGDGSDKSWSSNSSDRQDMLTQPAFIHPSSAQASAASSASDASEPVPESSSARAQLTSEPGVWPSSAQAADAEAGRLQGSLHIAENAQPELQGVARASSSQARAPRTQAQAPQAGAAQQQLSITRRQALSNFWAVIDGYPERRLVPRATNAAVPLDRVFEEEEM